MNAKTNPFEQDLDKNPANYAPLTPLPFIERAACGVSGAPRGGARRTALHLERDLRPLPRLASALAKRGIGKGDTVAAMLANTPEMYECHFGVPMTGAVLNTLNTRLDAEAIAFMLNHGEAKVLITDREFSPRSKEALKKLEGASSGHRRRGSGVHGRQAPGRERLRGAARGRRPGIRLAYGRTDEWQAISLNYTSGTTGDPKGVVYHHRGAYLNAHLQHRHLGHAAPRGVPVDAADVPLQRLVLPLDHGGERRAPTSVLRRVEAAKIFELIKAHKVTHYCGAPIVHSTLINAPEEMKQGITHKVSGMVAAAAPPAAMIEGMERLGFDITHVYGLTEVYGPATVCAKHEEWGSARHRRAHAPQRPPGRALPDGGGAHGDGPGDHAAGAGRRRDHGRDHVPRQHHHEGLPEEPEGDAGGVRRRLVPLAATWR